jgi:hypothetical protein
MRFPPAHPVSDDRAGYPVRKHRIHYSRVVFHYSPLAQQQIARWEAAAYRTAPLRKVEAVARELGLTLAAAGWRPETGLLAAESPASYGTSAPTGVAPVRDLGEVAARIRLFRACHLRRGDHGA